ncbi:DUF3592 domain-containing protein [Massilia oculi]|uniref:DUF3592 domain-containing protein n=1 Tax=Massilia hydrophila TaxID=3044279 RepID=A0ABS7YBV5_9BURK|nr:DUF3592 domain-containing protein [Massilia oculi]MCA1855759.1 DUF3592 domain-containing protein [Massilia oculi]
MLEQAASFPHDTMLVHPDADNQDQSFFAPPKTAVGTWAPCYTHQPNPVLVHEKANALPIRRSLSTPRKHAAIACILIVLALALGLFTVHRCLDKLRSPSWPRAHAQVLEATLHKRVKSGAWCVGLRYQYLVDRQLFTSSRFSLDASAACYRDRRHADALSGRVVPGARIWIRYDPANPGKALIRLDALGVPDVLMLLLAFILLPAGALLLTGKVPRASG